MSNPTILPANLAALATLCGDSYRYAMGGVNVIAYGDATYRVAATDGKYGALVTGQSGDVAEWPVDSVPQLQTAPNGEMEALVPSADWKRAFTAARGKRKKAAGPRSVALVMGKEVSTLATSGEDGNTVSQPANVAGRFPDLPYAIPGGEPDATVSVDAELLAELLKVAQAFTQDGTANRVTLELRKGKPVVVRAQNETQQFTGIMMPLT